MQDVRVRQAFMYGMYHGIYSKLDEQRRQQVNQQGLILIGREVARRDEYMKRVWGDTKDHNAVPDCDATAAKLAGYQAGRETEIRAGLTKTGQATNLLEN
jgi:hypothetical protein